VHVISKRPFNQASRKHPNQRKALEAVYRVLRKGNFGSPDQMRCVFPSLDNFKHREKWWVIDVAGNHLRLIAFIQFTQNRLYVKHIVTHKEYDQLCWRYQKGELK
jgi:mRNA interferase HigB